jgi:hypothetical protein
MAGKDVFMAPLLEELREAVRSMSLINQTTVLLRPSGTSSKRGRR